MQKHLFLYAGIFALLITGIVFCLGMLAWMLFFQPEPHAAWYPGAQLVKEALNHALA